LDYLNMNEPTGESELIEETIDLQHDRLLNWRGSVLTMDSDNWCYRYSYTNKIRQIFFSNLEPIKHE
jgi:hypothetical protein